MQKRRNTYVSRRSTNRSEYSKSTSFMGSAKDAIANAKRNSDQGQIGVDHDRRFNKSDFEELHKGDLDRRVMIVISPSGSISHYSGGRYVPRKKSSARSH